MAKHIGVIGIGTFGGNVVRSLAQTQTDVVAIDENSDKIDEVSDLCAHAVHADATDEKVIRELALHEMDAVIISIGGNLEASILITMLLKNMGAPFVIVKAMSPLHATVLKKIGADKIVFPERDMAQRLAKSLISPDILDVIEVSPSYSLVEIKTPKKLAGKTLKESDIRSRFGIYVVAIKRKEPFVTDEGETDFKEDLHIAPDPNEEITEGDTLVLIGRIDQIQSLKELS
jgi:trk system potassium uptake protein